MALRSIDKCNIFMPRTVSGCVPFKLDDEGKVFVLMIQSLNRGDWIFPKGSVEHGETLEETAARETFEEAGVTGALGIGLGVIAIVSRAGNCADGNFFLLRVETEHEEYPEKHRRRHWLAIAEAEKCVERSYVQSILQRAIELLQRPAFI